MGFDQLQGHLPEPDRKGFAFTPYSWFLHRNIFSDLNNMFPPDDLAVAFQWEFRNINRMLLMTVYSMSCLVLTRPDNNYAVQYFALNISSAVLRCTAGSADSWELYSQSWRCLRVAGSVRSDGQFSWFLAAKQLTFLSSDIWYTVAAI